MNKGNPAFTGFFNNENKRVDLVLVTINKGGRKTEEMRIIFFTNIIKFGLELELDEGKMLEHRNLLFAKIHAPDYIIEEYGLFFNIRKFFKDSHLENINPFIDPLGIRNERELIKLLRQQYPEPVTYSTLERSKIVYNIIDRIPYGQHANICGISKLIQKNIIIDAFPLHDGPYFLVSRQGSTFNARQCLFYNWAGLLNIWRTQPIHLIQEYLGERIGLYFAFYEFFNLMLAIPAVVGYLVGLIHYFGKPGQLDLFAMHICHNKRVESFIICPQCRHFDLCPTRLVQSYCPELRFIKHIDSPYTNKFAAFVCMWSIFFVVLWKRREKYLKWIWEIKDVGHENANNPGYHVGRPRYYTSYLTGLTLDKLDWTVPITWLFRVLIYTAIFAVWLFGLFIVSTQIWYVKFWLDILYNKNDLKPTRRYEHIFIAIGAVIYSIIATVLKMLAKKLSHLFTALENNRTIGEYNFSLAVKLYAFDFSGTFAMLTFHIFVGHFFYTHLLDMDNWYSIAGFGVMSNRMGTSFDDIAITLAVAIVIEQIIVRIPIYLWRRSTDYQGALIRNSPSWEREYKLDTLKDDYIHDYYNQILIQFALSTLFSLTFTLAPLFILIINLWDIRHKARAILLTYRRPLFHNISGPAVWHKLIIITSFIVPIFNLAVIMLHSRRFYDMYVVVTPQIGVAVWGDDPIYPANWYYQPTAKERFDAFNSSLGMPCPREEYKKLPPGTGNVCNVSAQEQFFFSEQTNDFYAEYRWHHCKGIRFEYLMIFCSFGAIIYLFIYFHFPISNDTVDDTLNTERRIEQKFYIQKGVFPGNE